MTQNKAILEYLKNNDGISQREAVELFNCYRLSARIADLKKMGYCIETSMRSGRKPEGRPFTYAFYILRLDESTKALEI